MLTVPKAIRIVLKEVQPKNVAQVPLIKSLGMILAEDVVSDIDMPPFDKSAMDGYAVIASDTANAPVILDVVEEIPAGKYPTKKLRQGEAAKIMTGAPLPKGADAVIMVEKTSSTSSSKVNVLQVVRKGQNICFKREDLKVGGVVLKKGNPIRAQEIAVLASVGKANVKVYKKPSIAILTTGNELVDVTKKPTLGKIRNSNSFCISAQLATMGLECQDLGIARDNKTEIRNKIRKGLKDDVLIISGGVSVGEYDFVKESLAKEGVNMILYKVSIKPGKPFYFGKKGNKRIFALPGNPVSAFVIFEVFIRPFLLLMQGNENTQRKMITAKMRMPYEKTLERTLYLPAKLEYTSKGYSVEPVPWHGSADIFALTKANAFIIIEANSGGYVEGDMAKVMPI